MTDYTESGAAPVEDAAVDDPPTVDEELAARDARVADANTSDAASGAETDATAEGEA